MINSFSCSGCTGEGFEYQKSTTIRKILEEKKELIILGDAVTGLLIEDEIRLGNNTSPMR